MQQVPDNVVAPAEVQILTSTTTPGSPIVTQPLAPTGNPVPFGLEYLSRLAELVVNQQIEPLEALTGYETENKYVIRNAVGQQVYFAAEVSGDCCRHCCGPVRSFEMKIMDNTGMELIHLHRPYRCTTCWCFCCLQNMEVFAPPGTLLGRVKQNWSVCGPSYTLENAAGEALGYISGPWCTTGFMCCKNVDFKVMDRDRKEIGKIVKQWSGAVQEHFTDADNFAITFPRDHDVVTKALLLGACFLIDYMYYEVRPKKKKTEHDVHHPECA